MNKFGNTWILRTPSFAPETIVRSHTVFANLIDTVQRTGSAVTHLSVMGTTIVKGR